MNPLEIFLIALGLSMDAMAVAVAAALTVDRLRLRQVLLMALFFGGFQALMPLIGWIFGHQLAARILWIQTVDHWIAAGALWAIGGKMLVELFRHEPSAAAMHNPFALKTLLVMAIATSIDALAVGVGFGVSDVAIAPAATIIGLVTLAISIAGSYLGRRFGEVLESRAEMLGALVLIGLGIKIIVEHMLRGN